MQQEVIYQPMAAMSIITFDFFSDLRYPPTYAKLFSVVALTTKYWINLEWPYHSCNTHCALPWVRVVILTFLPYGWNPNLSNLSNQRQSYSTCNILWAELLMCCVDQRTLQLFMSNGPHSGKSARMSSKYRMLNFVALQRINIPILPIQSGTFACKS